MRHSASAAANSMLDSLWALQVARYSGSVGRRWIHISKMLRLEWNPIKMDWNKMTYTVPSKILRSYYITERFYSWHRWKSHVLLPPCVHQTVDLFNSPDTHIQHIEETHLWKKKKKKTDSICNDNFVQFFARLLLSVYITILLSDHIFTCIFKFGGSEKFWSSVI